MVKIILKPTMLSTDVCHRRFMPKLNCPHCNEIALSVLQKTFLGPAKRVKCIACHKVIRVHWGSSFFVLSFTVSLFILMLFDVDDAYSLIYGIFILILAMYLHINYLPLVKSD